MAEFLIPMFIGLVLAIPIAIAIRRYRGRAEKRRQSAPVVPVSRQHRRAIERRANKGR